MEKIIPCSLIMIDPLFAGNLFHVKIHGLSTSSRNSQHMQNIQENKDIMDNSVSSTVDLGFSLGEKYMPVPYIYPRNLLKFPR